MEPRLKLVPPFHGR